MYQSFIDIYVYIYTFFQGSSLRVTILLQSHIYIIYIQIYIYVSIIYWYIYTCLARFPEQLHRHRRWVPIALWDFLQGWMGTTSPSWYGCLTMTEVFVVQVWIKSKVSVHSRKILELGVHSPFTPFAAKIPLLSERKAFMCCNSATGPHHATPFEQIGRCSCSNQFPKSPLKKHEVPLWKFVKVCECVKSLI